MQMFCLVVPGSKTTFSQLLKPHILAGGHFVNFYFSNSTFQQRNQLFGLSEQWGYLSILLSNFHAFKSEKNWWIFCWVHGSQCLWTFSAIWVEWPLTLSYQHCSGEGSGVQIQLLPLNHPKTFLRIVANPTHEHIISQWQCSANGHCTASWLVPMVKKNYHY